MKGFWGFLGSRNLLGAPWVCWFEIGIVGLPSVDPPTRKCKSIAVPKKRTGKTRPIARPSGLLGVSFSQQLKALGSQPR